MSLSISRIPEREITILRFFHDRRCYVDVKVDGKFVLQFRTKRTASNAENMIEAAQKLSEWERKQTDARSET